MRHDWIFEVLKDLQSYALRHDLPALAAQADLALRVARAEIDAADTQGPTGDSTADEGGDEDDSDAPLSPRSRHRH
ncbi:MAG: hypothetical protein ACK4GW_12085 [Pseudorhodobacter sp.]